MTRSRTLIVGLVVLLAVGVGAYVAYDQVLSGDSTPPLALPSSSPVAVASADPTRRGERERGSGDERGARAASFDGDVAGTWTVAAGSQAGYRVTEQLASLPAASEAIGRTDQVTGQIVVTSDGTTTTVDSGSLTVDTTTITSDESRRDNRMRSEGLQTDEFPTATFTLTQPVEVPGRRARRDGDGHHPRRRPDPARRHEVGRDPGPGASGRWPDPGPGLDHVPAVGLRHRGAEHRRLHPLDRRRGHARVRRPVRPGLTAQLGGTPPVRRFATNAAAWARRSRFSLARMLLT